MAGGLSDPDCSCMPREQSRSTRKRRGQRNRKSRRKAPGLKATALAAQHGPGVGRVGKVNKKGGRSRRFYYKAVPSPEKWIGSSQAGYKRQEAPLLATSAEIAKFTFPAPMTTRGQKGTWRNPWRAQSGWQSPFSSGPWPLWPAA